MGEFGTLRNLSTNKVLMRKCCPKVLSVPPLERCLGTSIKSLYLNLIFQVLIRNQTQPTRKGCGKNAYAFRIVFKNDILAYRSCLCMDTKRSAAYTASFVELATMCLGTLSHRSGCMSKSSVANNLPCLASLSHSQKTGFPNSWSLSWYSVQKYTIFTKPLFPLQVLKGV